MAVALNYSRIMGPNGYSTDMEKRQVFLRSYQFSRQLSVSERIKKSVFRVKRVLWVRLRSAKKLKKMACSWSWLKLRNGFLFTLIMRRERKRHALHSCSCSHYEFLF